MSGLNARHVLKINSPEDEVDGFIVYGLFSPNGEGRIGFPAEAWSNSSLVSDFQLTGDGWLVRLWEIQVGTWPVGVEWRRALELTLNAMIRRGAVLAWVGAEGLPFCDPPELFDPECMSGGVLAWMLQSGETRLDLDPDRPLRPCNDVDLVLLRESAGGF